MSAGARRIFLSYRRDDCAAHAGWLAETLRRHAAGEVFLDVDTIGLGENFVKRIEREIERCDVVLVLIGREWLTLADQEGKPRIFDELDWVHLEIKAALERDIPVVPVLVEGARMPRPQDLPASVHELCYRNGFELSPARWEADVSRLVAQLPPVAAGAEAQRPAAPTPVSAPPDAEVPPVDTSAEQLSPFGVRGRQRTNRTGDDVVVVPAQLAYPDYLLTSGYVCQDDRAFRGGITRLGFYGGMEIKPEFPLILDWRARVVFSSENADALRRRGEQFDAEVAALIDSSFDRASGLRCARRYGERYDVFCLTPADDQRTLRLPAPVHHRGSSAWTQNQRYVSSEVLGRGPRTTDDL